MKKIIADSSFTILLILISIYLITFVTLILFKLIFIESNYMKLGMVATEILLIPLVQSRRILWKRQHGGSFYILNNRGVLFAVYLLITVIILVSIALFWLNNVPIIIIGMIVSFTILVFILIKVNIISRINLNGG